MRLKQRLVLAVIAIAVAVPLLAASAASANTISATCSWGTQSQECDSTFWYPSSVTVVWQASPAPTSVSGCQLGIANTFTTDSVNSLSCTATWPGPSSTNTQYTIHVETSSPAVSVALARPPDHNGWYTNPVGATVTGSSFSQGVVCTQPKRYSGPDSANVSLGGTCTDTAGKSTPGRVSFNYDATPPTLTGWTASRPPDFNGWYNHPVSFTFAGLDSVSGIDGCDTVLYTGPDLGNAFALGGCRDHAGNVATASIPLRYDATPPSLQASARTGDQDVQVSWQTPAHLSSLTISRSPGLHGAGDSVMDQGGNGPFNDTRVRNGVRYTYTISARDQAGNITVRKLRAIPGLRLLFPVGGVQVTAPPLLAWTEARHASYYNVQMYRAGKKVLSAWPADARLSLGHSWVFGGRRFRLKPGRYRWYVWPGFGSRRSARYGSAIGAGTFVVTGAP